MRFPKSSLCAAVAALAFGAGCASHETFPLRGDAQPVGALTGATIFVSAGHGWYYTDGKWDTQRHNSFGVVEDLSNAETVNQYLVPYLWNAGANVVTVRERDMQTNMVIVQAADDSIITQGDSQLEDNEFAYGGRQLVLRTTSGDSSAQAGFVPSIPADGYYAVYAWHSLPVSGAACTDASITIRHTGGDTTWHQDMTQDIDTWKYLGTYYFVAGRDASLGAVVLDNHSTSGGHYAGLSAVRFGGGMGDAEVDGKTSGKPRWEESGLYYATFAGMPLPPSGDARPWNQVRAMPRFSEWQAEPWMKDHAIYVAWHTNASENHTSSGISSYIYGENAWGPPWDFSGYPGSDKLGRLLQDTIRDDVRAARDAQWEDVGLITRWLGETNPTSNAKMPAALVENGFHDNPHDAGYILDPEFRRLSARAAYKAIVKYYHENVPGFEIAAIAPETPTHLIARKEGMNRVEVSWDEPPTDSGDGLQGDPATSYRIYRSNDGYGWDNGLPAFYTSTFLDGVTPGDTIFVRVAAVNDGGESFPSETLAVRVPERMIPADVLIVSGFDRLDRGLNVIDDKTWPGERVERTILSKMNTFNYTAQHAAALHAAGWDFDSCSNDSVERGDIRLRDYRIVVWILGNEGDDSTLTATERQLIADYLKTGGALFISGANLAHDLGERGDEAAKKFLRETIKAECVRDSAGTFEARAPEGGLLEKAGVVAFDDGTGSTYPVMSADVIRPAEGAKSILEYSTGESGAIRVDAPYRLVYLAFPFETITDARKREEIMTRSMAFLNREM